jgi:hypothetical protein
MRMEISSVRAQTAIEHLLVHGEDLVCFRK